jgi:hypothetical protein
MTPPPGPVTFQTQAALAVAPAASATIRKLRKRLFENIVPV